MTTREDSAQGSPENIDSFPSTICSGKLYRSALARYPDFGYFSSGEGRFDLAPPHGTLYLARSIHSAVMERVAAPSTNPPSTGGLTRRRALLSGGKIDEEQARNILVWEVASESPLTLADLTAKKAARFGVTNELSSAPGNYHLAQEWAAAFHEADLDGIEYNSRFVTSKKRSDNCVAVFGDSGAKNGSFSSVSDPTTLEEVAEEAGVEVVRATAAPTNVVSDF